MISPHLLYLASFSIDHSMARESLHTCATPLLTSHRMRCRHFCTCTAHMRTLLLLRSSFVFTLPSRSHADAFLFFRINSSVQIDALIKRHGPKGANDGLEKEKLFFTQYIKQRLSADPALQKVKVDDTFVNEMKDVSAATSGSIIWGMGSWPACL